MYTLTKVLELCSISYCVPLVKVTYSWHCRLRAVDLQNCYAKR